MVLSKKLKINIMTKQLLRKVISPSTVGIDGSASLSNSFEQMGHRKGSKEKNQRTRRVSIDAEKNKPAKKKQKQTHSNDKEARATVLSSRE